jgi:hypothetical protein
VIVVVTWRSRSPALRVQVRVDALDGLIDLKELRELVHRKPGFSNQRPKGSFGQFCVVGNGEASMRRVGVSKNDVTPMLRIPFVSDFTECPGSVSTGNHRQLHPPATSMTSSRMLGGNGSPCFRRLIK